MVEHKLMWEGRLIQSLAAGDWKELSPKWPEGRVWYNVSEWQTEAKL